jgi:hypothetical protein
MGIFLTQLISQLFAKLSLYMLLKNQHVSSWRRWGGAQDWSGFWDHEVVVLDSWAAISYCHTSNSNLVYVLTV